MVLPFVLLYSGKNTERDTDRNRENKRIDVDEHGGQKSAGEQIPSGRRLLDLPGRTEIPFGKDALEILSLTPAGKKSMPVSAFLNGVRGENIEILPGVIPE